MRRWLVALVACTSLLACAPPRYVYAPTRITGADVSGAPAFVQPIPRGEARGELRAFTFGIVPLDAERPDSEPAAHVRLVVVNRSAERWTIDPAEQRVELEAERAPVFVQAARAGRRPLTVAPGDAAIVDLLFPLPEGRRTADQLLVFDLLAVVRGGSFVAAERIRFERFRATRAAPEPPANGTLPSEIPSPQPPARHPPPRGGE